MLLSERDLERFNLLVMPEPNTGCSIWLGSLNDSGYGVFSFDDTTLGAHVVSHWQFKGPVKPNHEVHHRCRVRCCVNDAHLDALSKKEHARQLKFAPLGSERASSKLGIWLVRNSISQPSFAEMIGVSQACISRVITGERRPSEDTIRRIFAATKGEITPNDLMLRDFRTAA
jgi:hypothetical protein